MGMASSQARLLTLTARLHSIEWKAQKLEADKLRLANDTDHVYETYLERLDTTKFQYSALTRDGAITYRDATLNAMENGVLGDWAGETSKNILFLQNQDGEILVTPAVAAKYGIVNKGSETRDLDTFIQETTGKSKIEKQHFKDVPIVEYVDEMETIETEDREKIKSFAPVGVTFTPGLKPLPTLNPVDNVDGLDNVIYDDFQIQSVKSHPVNTSSLQKLSEVADSLTAADTGTYKISDIDDLKALKSLYNKNANKTFVLANDIDFAALNLTNAEMVNDVADIILNTGSTFDGNGYHFKNYTFKSDNSNPNSIKGLGIFSTVCDGATVKNLGVENINLNACNITGGICARNRGTISNCYVTGNVFTTGDSAYAHAGGICGENTGTLDNCNFSGKVNASSGQCVGSISGHNSGTLNSCWATGEVKGYNWVGGLVGHNTGTTIINNCITACEVSGTHCVGSVIGSTRYKEGGKDPSKWVEYAPGENHLEINNIIFDPHHARTLDYTGDQGNVGTEDTFKKGVTTPSIDPNTYEGGFYSNIIGALVKSGMDESEINETAVKQYVKSLYDAHNNENGGVKIANINKELYNYITSSATNGFIDALKSDIQNGTISQTTQAKYQTKYSASKYSEHISNDTSDAWSPTSGTGTKGSVNAPSANTIAKELYYAIKIANPATTITEDYIKNWISQYNVGSNQDKIYLANIAQKIAKKENLSDVFSAIQANRKFTDESYFKEKDYLVSLRGDENVDVTYGTKTEERPTGKKIEQITGYKKELDYVETVWDMDDPDIANAIAMWSMARRGVVVTEEQASSYVWLKNMVQVGEAVFTTFDPEKIAVLGAMSDDEINNMTDAEYEKLMGIVNTSVSVETFMIEVSDEIGVKKAEAQYEADMKKIDRKDRYYDTEIAKCENERSAIIDELDTLKTVAKENVDRTFKLFS